MAKPELRDHRKFLKLRRLLNEPAPHVMGYLEFLWLRGYQTGSPVVGDSSDVEGAAEYPGEAGKFTKAAHDSGFLDFADGVYSIHDLYEHAPKYAKMRMKRAGTDVKPKQPRKPRKSKVVTEGTNVPCKGTDVPREGTSVPGRGTEVKDNFRNEPHIRDPKPKPRTENKPLPAHAGEGKPRPVNPLFDAIAELAGVDPVTAGGQIGKTTALLSKAEPPYTAADVAEFGRRFWELCPYAAKDERRRPFVGEIEKYIGLLRAKPPPNQTAPVPAAKPTPGQARDNAYARTLQNVLNLPDPEPR